MTEREQERGAILGPLITLARSAGLSPSWAYARALPVLLRADRREAEAAFAAHVASLTPIDREG